MGRVEGNLGGNPAWYSTEHIKWRISEKYIDYFVHYSPYDFLGNLTKGTV
jgi:hypothetical protein